MKLDTPINGDVTQSGCIIEPPYTKVTRIYICDTHDTLPVCLYRNTRHNIPQGRVRVMSVNYIHK